MRKILLFFIFYLAVCHCASGQAIKVYFSPNGGCQQAVISEIRKAGQTIDIAMYYLSSRDIAQALVKAHENNVRVRIVLDQGQEIESASKSTYLIKHGFDLRYHLGFGLMHNKFAIIDGKTLITGSFNWTLTAEERNEENMLIITDEGTIKEYQARFEYLWNTSRLDARNARGLEVFPSWFCSTFRLFCRLSIDNAWADDDTSSAPAIDTYNKAVRLYEAQNWDAAKDCFHEYLAEYSDTPLYVTCLYYLAYCYQQLGDKDQSVLLYHKVIDRAQGGDAFWADMAQKRIQEILE